MSHSRRNFLALLGSITSYTVLSRAGETQSKRDSSLISVPANEERSSHPITLQEIVATRSVREPQLSPDGRTVAFIVQQSILESNDSRSALFVARTDRLSQPVKLIEE